MPYHIFFSTTLLLYKLDTLLLKQKKRPVLGLHMSTHAEKEIRYIQYGHIILYCILYMLVRIILVGTMPGTLKFILKNRVSHVWTVQCKCNRHDKVVLKCQTFKL